MGRRLGDRFWSPVEGSPLPWSGPSSRWVLLGTALEARGERSDPAG